MANCTGSNWDSLMSGYLDEYGKNEHIESEINCYFFKLTKVLEKKSSLYWHIRSFRDYINDNMNPLGLRVQIFPNLEGLDTELKNAWEKILRTCSKDLMKLLITEYQKRSNVLDGDIQTICLKLQLLQTHKIYMDKELKLKKHLEDFNKDILIKKESKLSRDRCAFEENRAYKWNQLQPKNFNRFRNRRDHYSAISNSSSSVSSVSSQVSSKNKKVPRSNQGDNRPQGSRTHNTNTTDGPHNMPSVAGRAPLGASSCSASAPIVPLVGNTNSPPVTRSRTTHQGGDRQ